MTLASQLTETLNKRLARVERGVAGKPIEEQITAYEKVIARQAWRDTLLKPAIIARAQTAIRRLQAVLHPPGRQERS
jgi:hypothetical protein